MVNELQRFLVLRKRMDDVIGNFLSDGLQPSETMIGHIVEMEDGVEFEKATQSERGKKSRAILSRPVNRFVTEQVVSDNREYTGVVDSAKELLQTVDVVHILTMNNITF
ncbi:unnamed protein product [Lactuca saligna]|uniref:Uncharacterized protein n=1 Tax=Lactuca saligna TaxID=75948 RepID=A0AA35YSM3_LACSI|nr:unnamed protein product [Lactuca saligna]